MWTDVEAVGGFRTEDGNHPENVRVAPQKQRP